MPDTDPRLAALPCGYRFIGGPCYQGPDHPVHIGGWRGPEPKHDYQPTERRQHERRALPPCDHAAELDRLRGIEAATRAYFAALAGKGHPDSPHDRDLHTIAGHDSSCLGTTRTDCSACAGAEYGTEDWLQTALEPR